MKRSSYFILACLVLALNTLGAVHGASPEAQGVSSAEVSAWIDALAHVDHPRDCLVWRRGRRVAVGSWRGVLRGVGQTNEGAINGRTPNGRYRILQKRDTLIIVR